VETPNPNFGRSFAASTDYFRRTAIALIVTCVSLVGCNSSAPPAAGAPDASLRASLQRDLNGYLATRSTIEHISAISLSVSLHGDPQTIDVTAGRSRYGGGGAPVTPANLWQIGSNTKALTAATILELEAEGKLTVDQRLGRWLPQYPAWKGVTIRRLLNMTSGIPSYDHVPAMLAAYARDPKRHFTLAELVAYVYPANPRAPPPPNGFLYSNTNYLLAEMIVERATGHSFTSEIARRFLRANLGLESTYYAAFTYPPSVLERMVSGYFFSRDPVAAPLAPLLGRDMREASVSWLQAAGGIVSTPGDLARWAHALYTGHILAPTQQAELTSIVSEKTGKPIAKTSLQDPRGFGLGVGQLTTAQTGTIWFYEGSTFGYRMLHLYFPRQGVVIAFGLNSLPDSKEDSSAKLALSIYETLHAAGKF
jgi:D-alanyl-D-alanine carboxypeptidase